MAKFTGLRRKSDGSGLTTLGGHGQRVRDVKTGMKTIVQPEDMPAFIAQQQMQGQQIQQTQDDLGQAWNQSAQIQQALLKQKAAEAEAKRAEQLKRYELDASIRDRDVKNRLSYNSQRIQEDAGLRQSDIQRSGLQDAMTRFSEEMGLRAKTQDQSNQNSRYGLYLQQKAQDNSMYNAEAGRDLTREQMEQSAVQFAEKMGLDYHTLDMRQQEFLLQLSQQDSQFGTTNERAYAQMDQSQGQFDATLDQRASQHLAGMELDWKRFESDAVYRKNSLDQARSLAQQEIDQRGTQNTATNDWRNRSLDASTASDSRQQDRREMESDMDMSQIANSRRMEIQRVLSMGQNLNPEGQKKLSEFKNKIMAMMKSANNLRPNQQAEMYQGILNQIEEVYWEGFQLEPRTPQNEVDSRTVHTPAGPGLFNPQTGQVDVYPTETDVPKPADPLEPITPQTISKMLTDDPKAQQGLIATVQEGLQGEKQARWDAWNDIKNNSLEGNAGPEPSRVVTPEELQSGIRASIEKQAAMQDSIRRGGLTPEQRQSLIAPQAKVGGSNLSMGRHDSFGSPPPMSIEADQIMQTPEAQNWQPGSSGTAYVWEPAASGKVTKQDPHGFIGQAADFTSDPKAAFASGRQKALKSNKPHVSTATKEHMGKWQEHGGQIIPNSALADLTEETLAGLPQLWVDEGGTFHFKVEFVKEIKESERAPSQAWPNYPTNENRAVAY